MFVPGLRRGFAILSVEARTGEEQQQFRGRIREALKAIRAAKIVTGTKPQGGDRYFFAAMSETPERRRRAKVKQLVLDRRRSPPTRGRIWHWEPVVRNMRKGRLHPFDADFVVFLRTSSWSRGKGNPERKPYRSLLANKPKNGGGQPFDTALQ